MAEIVRQRQRLGEILVAAQRARQRAGDLRHLDRVGQPGAVMIALMRDEHLGLVLQPAEGGRMDDAVAVALERRAGRALAAPRYRRPAAQRRDRRHRAREDGAFRPTGISAPSAQLTLPAWRT